MQKPLVGLTSENLVREATAGVTLLAIAIPLNIGYAQIAGLPPTAGLYALVLPGILYALTVSSRQVVASPDAAAAALVASSVGALAVAGSEDYLTLAWPRHCSAGSCSSGFGVQAGLPGELPLEADPGWLRRRPGAGHRGQPGREDARRQDRLRRRVRREARRSGHRTGHDQRLVGGDLGGLGDGPGRRQTLAKGIPWALLVLVVATVVVVLGDLADAGVKVLGAVEAGAPTLTWPDLAWHQWPALVPSAIALTLVTTAEGLLVSRSYGENASTGPSRTGTCSRSVSATWRPGSAVVSRSARRPRGPPRWTRPARGPNCPRWSPPSAPCCC